MKYIERSNRWEQHFSLFDVNSGFYERWEWCISTFGQPQKTTWGYNGSWICLYDEKCYMLYVLRWL